MPITYIESTASYLNPQILMKEKCPKGHAPFS